MQVEKAVIRHNHSNLEHGEVKIGQIPYLFFCKKTCIVI
jgi:hypothetical protein